ncbi:chemotaxis protein CheW [Corallococcus macrosporus]|uniref:Chemotaxis protein CheW n=1 Tax=Corallococcus macrosporus DSM 14697 TaxID=1189310 RepID=A0A250JU83_9BACT|nr:chemotaxis protein CheW [Corallococcus macrosporus]ATB47037.1 chemotaxis protein CheW [Corallococcus macrosporus DSM 14697]
MPDTPENPMAARSRRLSVEERLGQLEAEQARLRQELASLAGELRLPGMYLTVDAAGTSALLDAESVQEVVRLVELEPLPGAPAHVAGTFVYRGSPAVVVDLAALLGVKREASLDAHLVVCGGARTIAVLVDRVRDLVEAPVLVDGTPEGTSPLPWDASGLMAGLCRTPEGVRPLLRMSAVLVGPEAP